MCDQAVEVYVKLGKIKDAIDCCVGLNQVCMHAYMYLQVSHQLYVTNHLYVHVIPSYDMHVTCVFAVGPRHGLGW